MTIPCFSRCLKIISLGLIVLFGSCNVSKTGIDKNAKMQSFYLEGTRFNKQNEFKKAILSFEKSLHYANNFQNNKVKAECYNGIAYAYFRMNKYHFANLFFERALQLKPSDSKLTDSQLLSAIGNCCHFSGILDSAEYYYAKAEKLASSPNDKCIVWNSWSLLKQQIGRYDTSLMLLEKAKSQLKHIESGKLRQEVLMNLGVLNFILNDTANALKYYFNALAEADKKNDTISMAVVLLNRGRLYLELQQNDKASADLKSAKNLLDLKNATSQGDAYYWLLLCESEKYYRGNGAISAGISLQGILNAIELDGNPFLRLAALSALGSVKNSMKEYGEGIKLYQRILSFMDSTKFNQFEFKVGAYNGIARSYEGLNDFIEAGEYYRKASFALKEQIQSQMSFFSESDRTQYIESVQSLFESPVSFTMRVKDKIPAMCALIYDNCLFLKGSQMSGTRSMLEEIRNESDKKAMQTLVQWNKLKNTLAFQYTLPYEKRTSDIIGIEEKANELERELVKSSSGFAAEKGNLAVTWKTVREKLNTKEAAIEFLTFNNYKADGTSDTVYCALVLRSNYEFPKLVYLTEKNNLYDQLIMRPDESDTSQINRIYSSNLTYELIWKPLDSLLDDVETVYYSPVGLLHTVSFAAIRLQDHRNLSDKYKLNLVTSTKQVVFPEADFRLADMTSAALFGGIYYSVEQPKSNSNSGRIGIYKNSVEYLEGTLAEITEVESLLTRNGIRPATFRELNATEASFKNALSAKGVSIIHVSTHGVYFRDLKQRGENLIYGEQVLRHADNPLFRSGLMMAGINDRWHGKTPVEDADDGFLTAYEVGNTDLSKTRLVVLSACETGLGDIKGTEGVYGLQRAFKIAGADFVIISLWKVPDNQTTELMKTFYENWATGIGIREAFGNAQSLMSKKYDPYYWAAFVLSN
ncbi:MAG: CHAT domain-containing protein [Bacteroidales bacterium]